MLLCSVDPGSIQEEDSPFDYGTTHPTINFLCLFLASKYNSFIDFLLFFRPELALVQMTTLLLRYFQAIPVNICNSDFSTDCTNTKHSKSGQLPWDIGLHSLVN